jgi:hypothetical protein
VESFWTLRKLGDLGIPLPSELVVAISKLCLSPSLILSRDYIFFRLIKFILEYVELVVMAQVTFLTELIDPKL